MPWWCATRTVVYSISSIGSKGLPHWGCSSVGKPVLWCQKDPDHCLLLGFRVIPIQIPGESWSIWVVNMEPELKFSTFLILTFRKSWWEKGDGCNFQLVCHEWCATWAKRGESLTFVRMWASSVGCHGGVSKNWWCVLTIFVIMIVKWDLKKAENCWAKGTSLWCSCWWGPKLWHCYKAWIGCQARWDFSRARFLVSCYGKMGYCSNKPKFGLLRSQWSVGSYDVLI